MADLGFSQQAGADGVADNIKFSFYIGAAVFMVAILVTVLFTREYAPKEYELYHGKQTNETPNGGGVGEIVTDFKRMPRTMKQLGLVQFFSWFALFSMWVFTTDAVATHVYGLSGDYTKSVEYNTAGNEVSAAFGTYNFVAMFYALLLPLIAKYLGRKATHAVSLIAGGAGLISIYFIKDPSMLHFSMIGVGIAWASILAMPYVILSGAIPAGKLGIYMGIFNFFITLPQIINGLFGGLIVKHIYSDNYIFAIVMAGVFLILAAISVLFVNDIGATKIKGDVLENGIS
jgi:maltose/moltooligosaccharide transporter